ncbi:MAG: hypothetical protein COB12_13215 [Flavobacterium sp.]|nr:MAG: hypothetical protein COB12_13215 [Flavobacterium sp.]
MKQTALYLSILFFSITSFGQNLSGSELLNKTISYHDPSGNWSTFNGTLNVVMEIPGKSNRTTKIKINLPEEYFYSKASRDKNTTEFILEKDNCKILFNGSTDFSEETAKENRLSCDRANMYKNYYTYLYGLPMKLKDSGTNIDEKVELKKFKGKEYLVLKVTYDEEVGKDIWYFYFDPNTFAMEIYQFYHSKKGDKEIDLESGEYILLTEEKIVNGIKLPKNRVWITNKNDKLLGTDILE